MYHPYTSITMYCNIIKVLHLYSSIDNSMLSFLCNGPFYSYSKFRGIQEGITLYTPHAPLCLIWQ